MRSPATPGNQVAEGEETLRTRFRQAAGQLTRAWALAAGDDQLAKVRFDVQFYEEVRIYMAKFDADERRANGEPIPEEIQLLLASLIAESTASGEIMDIYDAAGIPKPSLSDLTPDFARKAAAGPQPASGHRGAAQAGRRGIGEGVPAQPGSPARVLRAGDRVDDPATPTSSSPPPR